jgi:hypothetical protein
MHMDGIDKLDAGVPFSGSLSHARFVEIQRALTPWWGRLYMTWLVLLFCQAYFGGRGFLETLSDPEDVITYAIVSTAGIAFLWVLTRVVWRRAWQKGQQLHGAVAGNANSEGILWSTEVANSQYHWQKFIRARSTPNLLLLHYSARCALYFPREFFASDDQWAAFRALVDSRLPSR